MSISKRLSPFVPKCDNCGASIIPFLSSKKEINGVVLCGTCFKEAKKKYMKTKAEETIKKIEKGEA